MQLFRTLLLILLLSALAACGGQTETPLATDTPPPTDTPMPPTPTIMADNEPVRGEAVVDEIVIVQREGNVEATISGTVPDACTQISSIEQSLEGNTFTLMIQTARPADEVCAQVLEPFEQTVELDVEGLEPGQYTINVNGVTQDFELGSEVMLDTANVTISPESGPAGTTVQLTANGLPANTEIQLGAGLVASEYDIIGSATTDASGNLSLDIAVPDYFDSGDEMVFVVALNNNEAISNAFSVTEGEQVMFESSQMFLIALEDAGESGEMIGCNDSAIPVEINFEPTEAPLTASLETLLSAEEFYGQSGLYNALAQSDLTVEGIDITDGVADVNLSGNLTLSGACDAPRVQAQLEMTALQYSTIDSVNFFVNGQPLDEVLSTQ
jgi:predicted small lipoprotein YifL